MNQLKEAAIKSANAMRRSIYTILGVVLLISLSKALIPKTVYMALFSGNIFIDPIIGSIIGSILAGTPITSYILGGELLAQGISLVAVTAFLVAWVTVGMVQFPAEALLLGKKFAIARNVISFIFAIAVAIITVLIVGIA